MTFTIPDDIKEGHPSAMLVENKLIIVTPMIYEGGEEITVRCVNGRKPTDAEMQFMRELFWQKSDMVMEASMPGKKPRARRLMRPIYLFTN